MSRKRFKLWHSVAGLLALLFIESAFVALAPSGTTATLIILFAIVGAVVTLYVATEVIEEVRDSTYMVALLSIVATEFILFFMAQYWFLITISPESFPTLGNDFSSIALHSIMVFVFNPLYLPATTLGRMLMIVNTVSALGLVLFILQNVWEFQHKKTR